MQNLFSSRSGNTPNILHSRHMYQYQMENTKKWGGIFFFYLALITALHCRFIDWVNTKVGKYLSEYLKKSLQHLAAFFIHKYARNLILTMAFWRQTKAGQKIADKWAWLAVLSCKYLKNPSWDFKFFSSFCNPLVIDMKNIVKCWKDFFWYSTTPETCHALSLTYIKLSVWWACFVWIVIRIWLQSDPGLNFA